MSFHSHLPLPPVPLPPGKVRGRGGGGTINSARLPGEVTCALALGRTSPEQGGEEKLSAGPKAAVCMEMLSDQFGGSIRDAGSKWVEMELAMHVEVP